MAVPFQRSYWVIKSKFLAGYYPVHSEPAQEEQQFCEMLDHGIRCFIDLTEPGEMGEHKQPLKVYADLLTQIAKARGIEVLVYQYAIPDMAIPSPELMKTILNTIDEALRRKLPVYVHCWGGYGRTGTVVGCYLARHGLALGETVLDRIKELRQNEPMAWIHSPYTGQQMDMVCDWLPGE